MPLWLQSKDIRKTALTHMVDGCPELRPDRPAFIVSSTSWTADEDFSLLLQALDKYQAAKARDPSLPRLLVIITGKGAGRAPFEAEVAKREKSGQWPDVAVRCLFVSAKDYPVVLGCADLGISMHQSSSGRDLPMKVVDMFGCDVPVLARDFACIDELVKDGSNGRIFNTGDELGDQLIVSGPRRPVHLTVSPLLEAGRGWHSYVDVQAELTPRTRSPASHPRRNWTS